MRYFFHVISCAGEYRDEEGVACAGHGDAVGHAMFMATEIYRLLGDEVRSDARVAAFSVQVTDEMGKEITRAPIRLHKHWH
jgi:hypothetical protein